MDWEPVLQKIKADFDGKNGAREEALKICRQVIRMSSNAIRAVHRNEPEKAQHLLTEAGEFVTEASRMTADHPEIYNAGFVHDAQKEYTEAEVTFALIIGKPIPDPDELGVEYPAYLNGVGEAVGELRRHILDIIREDQVSRSDELLNAMDDIYYLLVSFDYPDAITGGLRRTTDGARAIMERTRGDLTTAIRQKMLKQAISGLEQRIENWNPNA
ncbi:MAG: haloacid dehalogenase [Candidatus Geothermincolia bacterium]